MTMRSMAALAVPEKIQGAVHSVRGLQLGDLAWSVGLLLAAFVAGRIVAWIILRATQRWAKKTTTVLDDMVVQHMPKPLRLLLPAIAVELVVPLLSLQTDTLHHAVLVVIIIAAGWTCLRLLRVIEDYVTSRYDTGGEETVEARSVYTQLRGLRNIGGFAVILVTLAFALMTFQTVRNIGTGLLASAGVAGIVLGFAAQRSIATVLAGVQIAVAQPIRVDDVVIVEGEWGTIEEIALTYVVVKIWDLRRLIVPVNYFIDKPFQNWTRGANELLGTVELHLDYSVPVEVMRKEFMRFLEAHELWDKKAGGVTVTDATEHTMLVRLLVSAKDSSDQWTLRCDAREKMIAWVQQNYPGALPRTRAEVEDERKAA